MTGSRRNALAIRWFLVLAFIASVLANGLHVAFEHHHEEALAHGLLVSDHDASDHDVAPDDHDDDDHHDHDARDHHIEARPASASSSYAPELAPVALITVAPEMATELLRGLTVDEQPLRIPDPLTHSPRRPRAPPLG